MNGVRIAMPFGFETAHAVRQEGGLALTLCPDLPGYWTVTHLKSGRRIGPGFQLLEQANELMDALLCCGDWTRAQKTIFSDREMIELAELVRSSAVETLRGGV